MFVDKTRKNLDFIVLSGHCSFRIENFGKESEEDKINLMMEFSKLLMSLELSKEQSEKQFAKLIIYLLDFCRERQLNVADKIFDEKLFDGGSIKPK